MNENTITLLRAEKRDSAVESISGLLAQQCDSAYAFGEIGNRIISPASAETIERLARALAELTR